MESKTKKSKLLKSSLAVSAIVCIGKVLGFLKQSVIAWAFGANAGTDIYFAADSYIAMFGQIQTASISPSVLTEYIHLNENNKKKDLELLLRKCYIVFPVIAVALILINIALSGPISSMLGITYSPEQRHELQKFVIFLCPVILFTSFSGVSNGILDANERFVPSKLLSLFFSLSIIIFISLFNKQLGVRSMLIGFLLGYGIHTVYVTLSAKKYFTLGRINKKDESFKRVLKSVLPLVVGNSVVDLGHLVDKIIASSLATNSVTYLYYGQVISNDLVNAVIITTIGTVLLPSLTRMVAGKCDGKTISDHICTILNIIVAVLIAITGLYIVEGHDLIKLFFERGEFTSEDSDHVNGIAVCYALGFIFIAIREILTKVHYAYQDTSTPMRNGIIGVVINSVLSIILSRFIGVAGVALATSISMVTVAMMMCFSIKKHIGVFPLNKAFLSSLVKSAVGCVLMIVIGMLLNSVLDEMFYLIRMVIVSGMMVLVFGGTLILLKHDSLKNVKKLIAKNK